ncbi:Transmembrane protease serine 13 [Trichinella papuae]|uniref:Transmembrane protease serine 13 n=1 Tax=Trichinella papuae TaxID=268474 RepID=A0A0V1N4R9_9BILA|nr:Transmembrane protease serine 13 [Trichinella papuae]
MKRFHHFGIFFYYALLMFCIIIKKTFSTNCGKPYFEPYLTNPQNPNRIVGGWVAKPYSFPWTVHILTHTSGFWYESCGGSLISLYSKNASDTILTASHCVRVNNRLVDANAITVTAGVFNIKKLEEPHRVTSKVLAYISDNFDDVSKANDIAILRLKVEIPHSEYISPVCLPYQNQELPWGETCFVSGWGLTRGKPSPKLRQVGIPILRNNNCPFIDAEDMFCAGAMSGGKDSCQGDSGGPLVCKLNDTFYQMGIVSFGDGCARKDHPGIYTKVPHYVKWIYDEAAKLPDLSTSSEVAGEDSGWLESTEEEAGDWSPYSTNGHSQTNYDPLQIGEEFRPPLSYPNGPSVNEEYPSQPPNFENPGNRPPYSLSNRPTMNEHRPPPPPNFPNLENQMPNSFENGPPMDKHHHNRPFADNSEYQSSLSFPRAPSVNENRPPPSNNRYSNS